ncbi:RhoGAP domain-containing protein [Heterostelium album PN500]|uniref:RhoGAP domain-containing protein n=1 Tax=Heterostelium pallidum (strain ATCC 26659 / Pp 5 / PN500) TaxID=670386 RepID=D3BV17_HETP5|nr:RhoGAP domain-containing protein [Heterostelium album PN500]EFA74955.1 RhoGAP domain-containing protein [Heterostelium album PN500]|eukprot:XP_020427089.1 RhoGAP domain-containing protein [Heterostelium album PN500]
MNTSSGKLKFSENLWEGFDLLCKRTENDLQQSKNILMFFKKRAELEDQHAKKLEKLASKLIGQNDSLEVSTTNNGWKKIVNSTYFESEQHQTFNGSILNKVCQPFQAMIKDMESKRKKIVNDGTRLRVDMKGMIEALKKSQTKYEKVSKELELTRLELKDLREQPDTASDIAKLEKKKERLELEQAQNDDEYKEQIKATNDFQNLYNTELMPKILNDFEHFMVTHIHLTRTYWVNWTKIINDLPPVYSQSYEGVKRLIDQVDNQNDVQDFIKKNMMKKVVGTAFQYEPYVEGKLQKKSGWNTKTLRDQFFSKSSTKKEDPMSPNTSVTNLYKPSVKEPLLPTASYGVSLEELMIKQRDTHPTLEVPRVLVVLAEVICKLKGHVQEGIFRVPGIVSSIKEYRLQIDRANFDLSAIDDVRTPAALFKQWLRDIPEPIIPLSLYQNCIENPAGSMELVKRIPAINFKVLSYLINFVQIFCRYEFVAHSKMGSSNMAMIFAPTILRCPSNDPSVMLSNVNHEKAFVENLIQNFPPPEREFLGLPVSSADAIMEEDGDIEELMVDEDDDINNNIKSDDEIEPVSQPQQDEPVFEKKRPTSTTSTPTTTSTNETTTADISTLSLSGGASNSNSNNNSPSLESSTPTQTTTTTTPTTNTTILTNVTPSSGNRRSSAQLGWVRVKPGAQQQQQQQP